MQLEAAKPAIDLTRSKWSREVGQFAIYGTWLYNEDKEDTEPCLVVIPRYRAYGFVPCCIALSAAYLYNDPRYLAHAAANYAKALGFEDMNSGYKLAELIHDHLSDLISMPPDPQKAVVVAEANIDLGNGKRKTIEVLDHEQTR